MAKVATTSRAGRGGAKPGERRGGRQKGTPNKTTGVLKDAIILAAEQAGEDGAGKGGLTGYLRRVADKDIKAFSALLGRVLPMQVTGADGGPLEAVFKTVYEQPHD